VNTAANVQIARPPLSAGFELPSREDLLVLRPGDWVKLVFVADPSPDSDLTAERMWVRLTRCDAIDEWVGLLDSAPVLVDLQPGDEIRFHPFDIVDITTFDLEEAVQ
jgi:hypothetical protein